MMYYFQTLDILPALCAGFFRPVIRTKVVRSTGEKMGLTLRKAVTSR